MKTIIFWKPVLKTNIYLGSNAKTVMFWGTLTNVIYFGGCSLKRFKLYDPSRNEYMLLAPN